MSPPSSPGLLLAVTTGALLAAGWSLATAVPTVSAGTPATAVVLSSASCTIGGQDTVSVLAPSGTATAQLDSCGQPVGTVLTVALEPDGSVGAVVAMAGTRGGARSAVVPAVVWGAATLLTAGAGAMSVRAGRTGRTRG